MRLKKSRIFYLALLPVAGLSPLLLAQSPSETALLSSTNPSVFGKPITLTATVTNPAAMPPTPTGTVAFYSGALLLGKATVLSGQAAINTVLPTGTSALKAVYSGDSTYLAGTSAAVPQTVNAAAAGKFAFPVFYTAGSDPFAVAVGDFNGDGKPDVAAVAPGDGAVDILLGNGDGTLQTAVPYGAGPAPQALIVEDFDGDGNPDLAVMDYFGGVSILLGNSDGTFKTAVSYGTDGNSPTAAAAGDFNGDGKYDLAVSGANGTVSVLLGNGDGTFQTAVGYPAAGTLGSVAIGDFNGDGIADLAVTDTGAGNVDILLGIGSMGVGNGTFGTATLFAAGKGASGVVVSDFNGDGKADLAVSDKADNAVVLLGNGDGTFQPAVAYGASTNQNQLGLAVEDFNGDGIPDIVAADDTGIYAFVLLGLGDGTFLPPAKDTAGYSPQSVSVSDFNGDGIPDLVLANNGGANISILLGVATSQSQTITFGTLPGVTFGALPLILGATASSGLAVDFFTTTAAVCTVSGVAVTVVAGGLCSITAVQPGNATYSAAPPVTQTFTIAPLAQTITFGTLGVQTVGSSPAPLSASATSGLTVMYVSNSQTVCTVSGATLTLLTTGTCSITASQPGNSDWTAAPPVTRTFQVSAGPPAIVSLSPSSGAGTSVTLKAVFTDPNGVGDLNTLLLQINNIQSSSNACYLYYQPSSRNLYLANNAGAWITPALTPNAVGTASNSQCTLNAAASSVTTSGNTLSLTVALSFNSSFTISRNVYLYAAGASGQNSGWVQAGTWTPNPIASPPTIVALTPNAGAGAAVTLQAIYADPNGAGDLNTLLLQINSTQSGANACYVYYKPQGNLLYLSTDAGTGWMTPALTPGVAGTVSNSQCTLNAGSSSVVMAGNNMNLIVALSFNSAFVGFRGVYLYAAGFSGLNSGWVKQGTWTPNPVAAPPAIVSLSPSAGAGTSVTYQAVYTDPNGANDLNTLLLQINSTQNGANACYVYYQPQGNLLYLANNAGAWITPGLPPGVAGTASNSQCTLNAGSSKVTMAGNNMMLSLALSFNTGFVSSRNVYLFAAGFSGLNSGWVEGGTFTPNPIAAPPTIVSLSPSSGSGDSVTLQAVYADPNGAGDLNTLLLQVNTIQSGGNACYVYYQPQGNHLYLANNAGAWITPALTPGVTGTASSSQCTLNAGSSKVTMSGNNLSLSVALTFSGTVAGLQNVYLYAAGYSGLNSGWVKEGAWTPNPIAGPPTIVSLSPNAGTGTSVTLQAVYSDPNGAADLNTLLLQVNSTQNSANACYVYYQPQGNRLYLATNAGAWITPALMPGVAGTASNNQCTLDAGASSVNTSGNNLTLNVALTFSGTFVGAKNVYLYAAGLSGLSSGWVKEGAWTP